jgi:hypothetical protein
MHRPRLECLLASNPYTQRATLRHRTPHDYRASEECFSEAGLADQAIEDVSTENIGEEMGRNETHIGREVPPKGN